METSTSHPSPSDPEGPAPDSVEASPLPEPGLSARLPRRLVPSPEGALSALVVAGSMLFVVLTLHPDLVLANTTPAGGDMGAHVWGPAFLRDHLIPHGRLSGWTPDWYAGFPAYQFYMVLPALAIVALDVLLPYGVAFKLITMSGLVALPLAAYLFGRLVRLPFPGPPLMSIAATLFLFDRSFTIYGGNIASTMAGEFSFTISLAFALVYLGVIIRGVHTGRHRALAAGLFAIVVLCHVIPAVFALGATLIVLVVYGSRRSVRYVVTTGMLGIAATGFWATRAEELPFTISLAFAGVYLVVMIRGVPTGRYRAPAAGLFAIVVLGHVPPAVFAIGATMVVMVVYASRRSFWYLATAGLVGSAVTGFWALPFLARHGYMTNMGYEKSTHYLQGLFPGRIGSTLTDWFGGNPDPALPGDVTVVFVLALVGAGIAVAYRQRFGMFLALSALVFGLAFVLIPEGRLWNPRLLPFWYLNLYLLAALAVSEAAQSVAVLLSDRPSRPNRWALLAAPALASVIALVVVSLPLRILPGGKVSKDGTSYSWLGLRTRDQSYVRGWAKWNYSGYERKEAFPEYRDVVGTMKWVGEHKGCGRAMWEYEADLNRFGTPMALMLLPYWTDGCIGSMEGLYFESASTTPYHFLNAAELSKSPSNPQRGLPYGTLDVDKGVDHLQMLGVRYYMAFSPQAIAAADRNSELTSVAVTGAWHVYEVEDAELVEALGVEPAVMTGVDGAGEGWLDPSVAWYLDPDAWDVPLVSKGPATWPRVRPGRSPEINRVRKAEVTGIEVDTDRIAFDVDRPGTPVLVKASYFPNWKVSGAKGPWRVTPSLMVVVPTSEHVVLSYGLTGVDWFARLLTLMGVAGLVVLARRPMRVDPIDDRDPDDHPGDHPGDDLQADPDGAPTDHLPREDPTDEPPTPVVVSGAADADPELRQAPEGASDPSGDR